MNSQTVERARREQDEVLESISQSLDRLKGISTGIGSELTQQQAMLGQLSEDMDDAGEGLNRSTSRIERLLRKKSTGTGAIAVLSTLCLGLVGIAVSK